MRTEINTKPSNTPDNNDIRRWRLSANLPLLYTDYETLSELEEDYGQYELLDLDLQMLTDDESMRLFGKDNPTRYKEMKHEFLIRPTKELKEYKPEMIDKKPTIDPINMIMMMRECAYRKNSDWMKSYLSISEAYNPSQQYQNLVDNQDAIKEMVSKSIYESNLCSNLNYTFPMYTPDQIPEAESGELEDGTPYDTWSKIYGEMLRGNRSKEFAYLRKNWFETITRLYSQYKNVESDTEREGYKKKLLTLGWNVELMPVTAQNVERISNRMKEKLMGIQSSIRLFDLSELNFPKIDYTDSMVNGIYFVCIKVDGVYKNIYVSNHAIGSSQIYLLAKYRTGTELIKVDHIPEYYGEFDIFFIPYENLTDYHIREREEDLNPTAETCGATVGEFKLFLYSLGIGGDVYKLFSGRAVDFDRNIYTNALKYISLSYSIRADVEKLAYNESGLISDTDDDILTMGEIKRILKFE